jgi:hypothetical protein
MSTDHSRDPWKVAGPVPSFVVPLFRMWHPETFQDLPTSSGRACPGCGLLLVCKLMVLPWEWRQVEYARCSTQHIFDGAVGTGQGRLLP